MISQGASKKGKYRDEQRSIRWRLIVLVLMLATGLAACDSLDRLLEVEQSAELPADRVEQPESITSLMAGVTGAFECAYARFVGASAVAGTELKSVSYAFLTLQPIDRRALTKEVTGYQTGTCNSGNFSATYTPISEARWLGDHVGELLEGWTDEQVPNRQAHLATAAAYSAYAHLLLGELFCSAALDGGPELTSDQILELAEGKFGVAMTRAEAVGDDRLLDLSRVGRARVRLNLGKTADALQDAELVPEGFRFDAVYSAESTRTENLFHDTNFDGSSISIGEPFRGLEWQGVIDPRTLVEPTDVTRADNLGVGADATVWRQLKYTSLSSPIPIARWAEAQLIIAEIEGGNRAVDIINVMHDRAGLPPFQSSDPAEIQAHVIQERERELFLEGQHIYTLIRLQSPFDPPVGTQYHQAAFYGDQRCFPLPQVEIDNNPNIQ